MNDQNNDAPDMLDFTNAMPKFCKGCDYNDDTVNDGQGPACVAVTDQYWACVRAFRSGKVEHGPVSYHEATGAPIIEEDEPGPERFEVKVVGNYLNAVATVIGPVDEETAMEVVKELVKHEDFNPMKHSIKIEPVEE